MKKRLSRSQIFCTLMGVVELVYYFFPWMDSGERRYNLLGYLMEWVRADNKEEVYKTIFQMSAEKAETYPQMFESAVAYLPITYIVITVVLVLSCMYMLTEIRGKKITKIPKLLLMGILTVCVMQMVDIRLYKYGIIFEGQVWISVVPERVCTYLLIFWILEGVWLSCMPVVEQLDEVARKLDEERRRSELQKQKLLESYIGNLERMLDETRAFQHDYKNILSMMAGFIRENQMDELREFFYTKIRLPEGSAGEQREAWKYLRNIYPMELKGFLYEKILSVLTHDIHIQLHSSQNINVEYRDMEALIRILGIFIDNAVEEAERLPDGEIGITIVGTEKGVLFCIENNFFVMPQISEMTKKGYSTKGDGRGLGLYLAQEILREHEDMVHELRITEDKVIQQIEILL